MNYAYCRGVMTGIFHEFEDPRPPISYAPKSVVKGAFLDGVREGKRIRQDAILSGELELELEKSTM